MKIGLVAYFFLFFVSPFVFAAHITLVPSDYGSGKMFLDCGFDQHDETCFLDTAATHTSIAPTSFSMKYDPVGHRQMGGAAGGMMTCDTVSVGHFSLGQPEVLALDSLEVTRCEQLPTVPSTVGIDVFKNKVVSLDFKTSEIDIVKSFPGDVHTYSLNVHSSGHISMPVSVAGVSTLGFFDTGAGLTSVDQSLVDHNPDQFDFVTEINGSDALGKSVSMKIYRAHEIRLGEKIFQGVTVVGFDFSAIRSGQEDFKDVQFVVGYNMIIEGQWYLDLNQMRWALR